MLLIVGAALFLRPGGGGWERSEGIRSPFLPPGQPLRPGVIAERPDSGPGAAMAPSGPVAGGAPDRAGIRDGAAAPSLEEIGPPGARVYHFTVGAPGDETAIYLVVDESIDI